jgi:hypothetical protein
MVTENPIVRDDFLYPKLRGRIVEKYQNIANFARTIGVEPNVISRKLGGKIGLTTNDIRQWSNLLEIPLEEIGIYFFMD